MNRGDASMLSLTANVLALASFALEIIAISTNGWKYENGYKYGLFSKCKETTNNCISLAADETHAYVNVTRSFLIIGIVSTFIAIICIFVFLKKRFQLHAAVSTGLLILSSIFVIIASSVYTANEIYKTTFEYSMWLSWSASILLMAAASFACCGKESDMYSKP